MTIRRLTLILSAIALLPCLAPAKRAAPTKVEPVMHDGICYIAPNDDACRAYVEAWDVQTNKKLWDVTVFTNRIDPKLEEDVQWVFINKLSVRDDILIATFERGKTYQVDLRTRTIERSPAPDETGQPHDIPEVINRAITNGSLAKDYEIYFRVN